MRSQHPANRVGAAVLLDGVESARQVNGADAPVKVWRVEWVCYQNISSRRFLQR